MFLTQSGLSLKAGMAPAGGLGAVAPRRHLNFHALSALHKICDVLFSFLDNPIGIVCKDSWTPLTVGTLTALAHQQLFTGTITAWKQMNLAKHRK